MQPSPLIGFIPWVTNLHFAICNIISIGAGFRVDVAMIFFEKYSKRRPEHMGKEAAIIKCQNPLSQKFSVLPLLVVVELLTKLWPLSNGLFTGFQHCMAIDFIHYALCTHVALFTMRCAQLTASSSARILDFVHSPLHRSSVPLKAAACRGHLGLRMAQQCSADAALVCNTVTILLIRHKVLQK